MHINPFSISCLLLTITCATIIIIALIARRNTYLHWLWIWFNLAVFIWGLCSFLSTQVTDIYVAQILWKIGMTGVIYTVVLFFHIVYVFNNFSFKKSLIAAYIQSIIAVIAVLSNQISNLKFMFNSFYYPVSIGWGYPFLYSSWIAILFYGQYKLFKVFRGSKGIVRMQLLYFFIGTSIGFSGGALNFLPVFGIKIYPYSNFLITVYCIIATYAIFRYRLMDINIVLTRAGIFIVVYTLVLGVPFWIGFKYLGKGLWILPASIMAAFATVGPFIYIFLQSRAEARLLKQKRARQDKLRELSSYMMRFTRLELLTNLIVHNTLKILELKHAALYLLETDPDKTRQFNLICSYGVPQKQNLPLSISLDSALAIELTNRKTAIEFEQIKHKATTGNNHKNFLYLQQELDLLKAHIVIPTFLRFRLMGFLILGESRAQEAFTQEDISVLQVLSNQAALAIENALFWQRDEEKLVESSKEEAASAVSFGAGHQFNNRLYAISMTVDGIFDMLANRDIEQMTIEELRALLKKVLIKLKKISEECQFGGQITAGIMSLTGTTPPNFAEFDISPIITSSIELVEMKHSRDKIEGNKPSVLITNNINQNLPLIFGSDAQVRDCLFNLIDNAYDAAYEKDSQIKKKDPELNWPEGQAYPPQIELKASVKDNYLIIDITDNGIGIKEENKKRLFAGYFTTKATSVKGYGQGGHGIGVFTVKKLILAHKGKIYFNSEYGKGTTFTIELPLAKGKGENKTP